MGQRQTLYPHTHAEERFQLCSRTLQGCILRLWFSLVLGLGVWLIGPSMGAIAAPVATVPSVHLAQTGSLQQLQQQQRQLEQQRSTINQQQEKLQNLQEQAENRLNGLKDTISVTAEKIKQNEQQLAIASQRLKELQTELARAEDSYQQRQSATVARLRFLQRQQGSEGWAVLLQSGSLNEFLDRRNQLKRVYQADHKILEDLKAEADVLKQRKQGVERQKNEIALLTQELQSQKAEYQAQAQTQSALVSRLQSDRQALEAAENELERDSNHLTQLIQDRIAAQDRNKIVLQGTGQFTIPSSGRLTSNFGYRVHPILGYRRFHAGVDFGAAAGSPIRAADSGTVIFAGWYGGYGRAVIISHGGSLTTLYGHASQVYVSEGQTVQRGQTIAAVGSTGFSTGPHLHFEVRVNGAPVNPMGYL